MRILVTGGAGFIGSHLAIAFSEVFPESRVIALDNLQLRVSSNRLNNLNPRLSKAS